MCTGREGERIHVPHESGPEGSFESWLFSSTVWRLGTELWHSVFGLHQLILPTEQSHWSRSINLKPLTKKEQTTYNQEVREMNNIHKASPQSYKNSQQLLSKIFHPLSLSTCHLCRQLSGVRGSLLVPNCSDLK